MGSGSRTATGVALAAAAALTACGGGASDSAKRFSGEKQKVAQVIEDLETASKDGDIERICEELLSRRAVAQGEKTLLGAVRSFGGKDKIDIDAQTVAISGSRATVQVRYSGGGRSRKGNVALVKEDGDWVIGRAGQS
jgi:hypothetical protein